MERTPEQDGYIEHNERSERNLLVNPIDTIRAMAEIEGPDWFTEQEAIQKGVASEGEYDCSLQNALERLAQGKATKVQGRHGWHRWFVARDGTVTFSAQHAEIQNPDRPNMYREILQKVRELGFDVLESDERN